MAWLRGLRVWAWRKVWKSTLERPGFPPGEVYLQDSGLPIGTGTSTAFRKGHVSAEAVSRKTLGVICFLLLLCHWESVCTTLFGFVVDFTILLTLI